MIWAGMYLFFSLQIQLKIGQEIDTKLNMLEQAIFAIGRKVQNWKIADSLGVTLIISGYVLLVRLKTILNIIVIAPSLTCQAFGIMTI